MKPLVYYRTRSLPYPSKHDFGTVYVYRAGKLVHEGDLREWSSVKDKYAVGYAIEKTTDLEAYRAARLAYTDEGNRLMAEFKRDLFEHCGVTGHPKAEQAYRIACELTESEQLSDIVIAFEEVSSLLKD